MNPDEEILLYVVRNQDGKYLRAKGYDGYGECWVDGIQKAKIYPKIAVAKAQITYWGKHYPQFGTPDLIVLSATIKEIVPQDERVKTVVAKSQKIELQQRSAENERKRLALLRQKTQIEDELKGLNRGRS